MATSTGERIDAQKAIQWLAEQRRRPSRQSQQVVEYGTFILEGGHLKKLGDDTWSFLEQVGIAALDLGRWELAELCTSRLHTRFPDSARVSCLQGMLMEGHGELSKALEWYDQLLEKDETNAMIAKRRIAVIRSLPRSHPRGGPEKAIEALVRHLDAFYTDPEGWLELASLYEELHMYPQAVFALEELLLLVPQNSFHVLQHAEALYSAGEPARAYKSYLRTLEMCGVVSEGGKAAGGGTREGPWVRALWGLKATTGQLLSSRSKAVSGDITAESVSAVDALATELLLNRAYAGPAGGVVRTRDAARKVFAAGA